MDTEEQQAVVAAARLWLGAQRGLDNEYAERQRYFVIRSGDTKPAPARLYSQVQVELNAERADRKLGPILAGFTPEQFSEYMRLTTK